MLISLKQLYGDKLGASDGEIGHVQDFYFDDLTWAVRYVAADTGTWLTGRQALISPHAFGKLETVEKVLLVHLNRKQIEDSPSIETHKPVSRQYEEEYHRYYGWPHYWEGAALWGMAGFPAYNPAEVMGDGQQALETANFGEGSDSHLHSAKAVKGYHIQASDGMSGLVCDFMMDPNNWAIRELVVKIGHRFSGREVRIPTSQVTEICYDSSTISVSMTVEAIENPTEGNLVRLP